MSRPDEPSTSYTKRRRTSSPIDENKRSPQQAPVYALPPPMVTCASPPSTLILTTTHSLSPVAYYPVYTTHTGHYFIASPPLHPTHPPKILPKLTPNHQAPPTAVTPSSSSAPYSYYPYHVSPPSTATTTALEREQARRQSHSAIEKKRREKINDKIMQLKQLIPTCADQENLNKMSILQSTIDYITYLKDILEDPQEQQQQQPIKLNWDLKNNKSLPTIETPPSTLSQPNMEEDKECNDSAPESHATTKNMSLKNMLC